MPNLLSNFGSSMSAWLSGAGMENGALGTSDPSNMGADMATVKMPPNVEHFLKIAKEEDLLELGHVAGRMQVQGDFMADLAKKAEQFNNGLDKYNQAVQKITTSVVTTRAKAVSSQAKMHVTTTKAGREMSFNHGVIAEHRTLGHPGKEHKVSTAVQSIFAEYYN